MYIKDPRCFINRELSWLEFNMRVLEEGKDRNNLLFERLKFLAITSSNLDEFFMVRVSGILELCDSGYAKPDAAGLTPMEQLDLISNKIHNLVSVQYKILNKIIIPELEREGFLFRKIVELTYKQEKFIKDYYLNNVYPVLTPMAIDQARPFPVLLNKSLNIIVALDSDDDEDMHYAVVQIPSVLPRILELPSDVVEGSNREFVLLEDVVKMNIQHLFEGHKVLKSRCFRLTRDSDFDIDESDSIDLLNEIEQSIKKRRWGEPVRLEIEKDMELELLDYLKDSLKYNGTDIYHINGFIDLTLFFGFYKISGTQGYKNETLKPQQIPELMDRDIFDAIKEKDILLHHPYQSFQYVIDFIKKAANDPKVLAIKQTLYRVSGNSPIINALIEAASNGKQVTVLVELKARFDEENNIVWARKLEKAGCHVVYGLIGLKTHCKLCLVVRKEDDGIHRYIHLGTGNYNDSTAKVYTDLGIFTCKESFGSDVSALFNVLTGYSNPPKWRKLAVAPESLRNMLQTWIDNEIQWAKDGGDGEIMIKVNSVVDSKIIQSLYRASMEGVKIKMIVRGICCIRPNIEGISENISIISIVDRYLEHSRIYYFKNGGDPKIFLSSADLMPRNLDKRIEVAFPVEQKDLKERVLKIFEVSFADTIKARKLNADGSYERKDARGKGKIQSQLVFQKKAEEEVQKYNEKKEEERKLYIPIQSEYEQEGE